jgi:hypothetical protein
MMKTFTLCSLINKYLKAIGQLIYVVKIDFANMIMINGQEVVMEHFVHSIQVFFEINS